MGVALLFAGYLWLVWNQFCFGPMVRVAVDRSLAAEVAVIHGVGLTPLASLPDTAYTLRNDQVKGLPVIGAQELSRLLPDFLWPGTLMLLGGLLLAGESARRKAVKMTSESGAKP